MIIIITFIIVVAIVAIITKIAMTVMILIIITITIIIHRYSFLPAFSQIKSNCAETKKMNIVVLR